MTLDRPDMPSGDDVEGRLDAIKREVDALQVHVMERVTPWYKQLPLVVSLLVSLAALSFSFWTNYRSEERLDRQEAHAARAELRGLIQRMQALPKENFELTRTYSEDPEAQATLGGLVNTENQVLGQQAAELIDELGGDVTAVEYYAAAYALQFSGQIPEAERLIDAGLAIAKDPTSEAALLRQAALISFAQGDVEGGRQTYQQALEVFKKYPQENETFVASYQAYTHMLWANSELAAQHCSEAVQHISASATFIPLVLPTDPVKGQQASAEQTIMKECADGVVDEIPAP